MLQKIAQRKRRARSEKLGSKSFKDVGLEKRGGGGRKVVFSVVAELH